MEYKLEECSSIMLDKIFTCRILMIVISQKRLDSCMKETNPLFKQRSTTCGKKVPARTVNLLIVVNAVFKLYILLLYGESTMYREGNHKHIINCVFTSIRWTSQIYAP